MSSIVASREESGTARRLWSVRVKRLSLCATVTVALISASVTGPLESQYTGRQDLTVTGTLVDEGGPVPGVEVRLRPFRSDWERDVAHLTGGEVLREAIVSARSGPDGSFSLVAPNAGPWRLEFARPGPTGERRTVSAPLYLPLLALAAPVVLEPVELPAWHPYFVKVADREGRPVEGALVFLDPAVEAWVRHTHSAGPEPKRLYPRSGLAVARTDVDGLIRFVLPTGEANAIVVAAGFGLHVGRATSGVSVLRLDPAAATVLRVRDAHDSRAPRVVVRTRGAVEVPLALTDSNGETEVSVSAKHALALSFEGSEGEHAQTGRLRWAPDRSLDGERVVDVRLQEAARIRGRVIDAGSGSLVSGAAIWAHSDPGHSALSDSLGFFSLSAPVRSGGMNLAIAASGFVSAKVVVSQAQLRVSSELSLVLEPAVPLRGVVVDDFGQAVGGADVRAEPYGERGSPYFSAGRPKPATSAPNGSFWIQDAPYATPYRLIVAAEGYASATEDLAPFGRDGVAQPVQVTLSRGRQPWGTIVDQDGAPVAGALIRLFRRTAEPRLPDLAGLPFMEDAVVTSASITHGEFVLRSVALGEYRVRISHPEYAELRETTISVPPGTGQYDLGVFVLLRGEEIEGVVVDPEGRPVAGAKVSSRQTDDDSTNQVRTATTDEEGLFHLTGLLPVPTLLTVSTDEYPPVVESFSPGADELVRMELVEGAVLSGRVLDLAGEAVAGVEVVLHPLRRTSSRPSSVLAGQNLFRVLAASDGSFSFGNLPPSSWLVRARDEAGRTAVERVELSRGEVRGVELGLQTTSRLVILVSNRFGEPLANVYVRVNPESSTWPPAFGRTDASGRVELQAGFGAATVDVSHPELSARSREILVGSGHNEVHVRLDPVRDNVESSDGYW